MFGSSSNFALAAITAITIAGTRNRIFSAKTPGIDHRLAARRSTSTSRISRTTGKPIATALQQSAAANRLAEANNQPRRRRTPPHPRKYASTDKVARPAHGR